MTAWSIDHAVHRLRTGQAQRDAQQRHRRAEAAQMRDQAAELVEDVWADRPELVEQVVTSDAFNAVVRGLDDAGQAGLEPRDLLAQINRDRLADPAIRDVGAYTAYSLRRVATRQGDEAHEAERRAEQQQNAADWLRQAWQHVPQAAEAVLAGPAFRFVADELAQLRADGHEPADVLASLSPDALLAAPQPAGATAHALKQQRRRLAAAGQEPVEPDSLSQQQHDRLLAAARATAEPTMTTAEPAGPDGEPDPDSAERDRLAAVTAAAAEYYQQQLTARPSERDYVAERLPDVDTARQRFTIGYAPDEWRAATDHLRQLGYSDTDLIDAGIAKQARTGGLIDRMRGRVVLAVRDEQNRIAGFIGRDRTGEQHAPKYLNTPSTALFDKSSIVFGLAEQRDRLVVGATPVLVEGTFDVLALATSEAGQQVVPVTTSGTAVTTQHLQALHRATGGRDVVLGLDGDEAGQTAAARAAEQALQLGMTARVVSLPDGHDPASWVQAHAHAPEQAAAPYRDAAQQRSAAELLAERAVQDYFAQHPPQHRDEVEGRVAAARAAAAALRHVDLAQASATGMRLAEQLSVEPVHMASLLAEARAGAHSAVLPEPEHLQSAELEAEPQPEPARDDQAEPERSPAEGDGAPVAEPQPVPAGTGQSEPGSGEQPVPHWSTREHGALTDRTLAERAETAQQQAERTAREREQAEQQAQTQRSAAEAGDGAEVRAVEENLTWLRAQAATAREADEVESTWHATMERAASAAESRARAEYDRDELGRFTGKRRRELDARIVELREQENTAQTEAAGLADRASQLQGQVGDGQQRRRVLTRANAAETDYGHAREAAHRRDTAAADAAERRAGRLAEQQAEHAQHAHGLEHERQLRAELGAHARQQEHHERAAALQPAEVTTGEPEREASDPTLGLQQQAQIAQQVQSEQQTRQPEPGEPER